MNTTFATLSMLIAQVAPFAGITDPPHSRGPHQTIYEVMAQPPAQVFKVVSTPDLEPCLTVALSFGIGGAPLVVHRQNETMIVSLIDRSFGLVSTMVVIKPTSEVEYRGKEEFELRFVRQCVSLPAKAN